MSYSQSPRTMGRKVYILSDSLAAIKAHNSLQIKSILDRNCQQSLVKLAEHNEIQFEWVPGHMGIDGNETADQLATQGSSHLLIGPQPTLCIFAKAARGFNRNWTGRKHADHWKYKDRLQAILKKILCRKSWDLFILSRNQLRTLKGLAT